MSQYYIMSKNHIEVKKKHLKIAVALIIILVASFSYFYYSNQNEIWEEIEIHEDNIANCGLELETSANQLDLDNAEIQIDNCRREINRALVKINRWEREHPNNGEVKAMSLAFSEEDLEVEA